MRGQDIRTIALPFFNNLKEEQIDYVVEKLKEGIENSIEYRVSSEEKKKRNTSFRLRVSGFKLRKIQGINSEK
ncbi:MAG: hypothetical protein CO097_07990 [Candidatus Infernicultor aquiphilus]|uniref:Uncharacterized protein n=1 Tax=Candidatus Infernicultor aquiphilus TaxID=1805029 RepID=A0A1J5GMQ6_9BACT|nr:MAG: hypothetical protein AUK42_01125 [Candidatus Atribacteria bacterium CG2_30_33_13]PJB55509.1 MAG: hypothetical protein CO097_07990 [Candidatus Atribacteria bacterium CG_4_9_14_3_um_filter_33_16]